MANMSHHNPAKRHLHLRFAPPLPSCHSSPQQPLSRGLRLWFFYQTPLGRLILSLPPTWWFLAWQHRLVGAYANSSTSKRDIPNFIKVKWDQ
jgi:hypothetical protein